MKFKCNLDLLSEAVENVSLAITQKPTNIAALEGVFFECSNNKLKLTGYDLDSAIIRTIDVDSQEDGSVIVHSNILCDMLKKMEGPDLQIDCNEKNIVNIKDDLTDYNIMGIDKDEYPKLPQKDEKFSFSIENKILTEMVSKTLFAVAVDSSQTPVLCGSMFSIQKGVLNVISVDGYRVAIAKEKIDVEKDEKFIIPSKTLKEILKLIGEMDGKVEITVGNHHATFSVGKYFIISRLLEGDFIDYSGAIPKESKTVVNLNSKDLLKTIERISVIVTQKVSVIMHITGKDEIEIESESSFGTSKEVFKSDIKGEPLKTIAFNNKYMQDALRHAESQVKITFNGPISPIKIEPVEGDSFLYLVLPVRLKTQL